MTDYDKEFLNNPDVFGPPFPEIVEFFENYSIQGSRVLDLGSGQGRDALFIARLGHQVLGVDIAKTGIDQMLNAAVREGLQLEGKVEDINAYQPAGEFDVILLDRVLHMLESDALRLALLEKACALTAPGGYILIADTPKNMPQIHHYFEAHPDIWLKVKDKKSFLFVQKPLDYPLR